VNLAMSKIVGFEPSGNSRSASKSFSISMSFMRSKSRIEAEKKKMSLSEVKLKVELSFQDVESVDADRLRHKVRAAREVKDLWMLRSDAHQMISRQISQHVAAERINALLPCFEHWMPASSLVKI
jgi:ERCC4-type nuclease